MPRSKTATDCDVFAVISFAIKRPVQPPPMMATSTGLRLVMRASLSFSAIHVRSSSVHTATPRGRCRGPWGLGETGRSFAGFARLVPGVVFGFEAVVLEQIGVRKKLLDKVERDRPREGFRIGNR